MACPPPAPRHLEIITRNNLASIKNNFMTRDNTTRIGINLGNTAGQTCSVDWAVSCKKFGFCALHTLNGKVLSMCSPEGHVLIFDKPYSTSHLVFPQVVVDVMKDPFIIMPTLEFERDRSFLLTDCDFTKFVVDLQPKAALYAQEVTKESLNYFRRELDRSLIISPETFNPFIKIHVQAVAQSARAVAYAVWFLTNRLALDSIGLDGTSNMVAYTRSLLRGNDPSLLTLDPYYVTTDEISLREDHVSNMEDSDIALNEIETWEINQPKHCDSSTPGFSYEGHLCRGCGLPFEVEHDCRVLLKCNYPLCRDLAEHSTFTCDTLRAWCSVCQHRGHVESYHEEGGFNQVYADHLFRKFSVFGIETGHVYRDPDYAKNEEYWSLSLYGLSPIDNPKAALEIGLPSADFTTTYIKGKSKKRKSRYRPKSDLPPKRPRQNVKTGRFNKRKSKFRRMESSETRDVNRSSLETPASGQKVGNFRSKKRTWQPRKFTRGGHTTKPGSSRKEIESQNNTSNDPGSEVVPPRRRFYRGRRRRFGSKRKRVEQLPWRDPGGGHVDVEEILVYEVSAPPANSPPSSPSIPPSPTWSTWSTAS